MDVIFELPSKENHFTIEVGFFDTVLEIKQKIQKYHGYPVSTQTLIFNGQTMTDEHNTEFYEVLHWSRIQLQIKPTPTQEEENPQSSGGFGKGKINEDTSSSSSTCSKTKVQLLIKIPASKRQFSLGDIDLNDSVLRLKEKIQENEGIPINRLAIFFVGNELMENRTLLEYGIVDLSEINVVIKTFPATTTSSGGGGGSSSSKKLKIMVLPAKSGAQKIQVEINPTDNVSELRTELQKLQQQQEHDVHLPAEGYFFIYKQTVMEEDRTFRWHDIKQGDTIEIFNGSVTGGS